MIRSNSRATTEESSSRDQDISPDDSHSSPESDDSHEMLDSESKNENFETCKSCLSTEDFDLL